MNSSSIVQKLWNYWNILRDDLPAYVHAQAGGLSYLLARGPSALAAQAGAQASGDYASARLSTSSEQLTFLLFLKLADEQSRAPFNKPSPIPTEFDWQSLLKRDGDEPETHYRHVLESRQRDGHVRRAAGQLGKRRRREQTREAKVANMDQREKTGISPGGS